MSSTSRGIQTNQPQTDRWVPKTIDLGQPMKLNLRKVAEFIRRAETEELLDRVTIYRAGMESAALDLMEHELDRRGVSMEMIANHGENRLLTAILLPDGTALRCSFCVRPAIIRARGWQKLFGRVPIFPRFFAYCKNHQNRSQQAAEPNSRHEMEM